MTFKAKIRVTLRPSILDPQGKATHHALHQLGFQGVSDVRMGKYIELTLDAASVEEARAVVAEAGAKLLSNAVMEDVSFDLEVVAS